MAYRYAGFGGATDTQSSTPSSTGTDPKYDGSSVVVVPASEADYTTGLPPKPGDAVALPSPSDLPVGPLPSGDQVLKPATLPATPSLPAMTSTTQSGSGLISSRGLFGVEWKWWILGGIVVAVFRATTRGGEKVAANKRRRRRRSR